MSYRAPLMGLPGSSAEGAAPNVSKGLNDPTAIADGRIRVELEDGTIQLRARRARHLMVHIFQTLRDNERELFTQQVLSSATAAEFRERGRSPSEAFDMLLERQRDIGKLFNRLPQGELTPGALWQKVADRTYRLKLQGARARDLKWNCMDARFEDGNWRLLWFGYDG